MTATAVKVALLAAARMGAIAPAPSLLLLLYECNRQQLYMQH